MINSNKYSGCFLGLAMGDAYGAQFEGGLIERLLWKIIGKTADGKFRYTDDTQMSIDLANSFLQNNEINQQHLAVTFANSYRWSRGYGPSAAWLLKKIKNGANWQNINRVKFKDGSFGNGAAMRAPVIAMCIPDNEKKLNENVVKCAEITHAHPLAIEGAKLIAFVTHAALNDWSTEAILKFLPIWCNSDEFKTKVTFCIKAILMSNSVKTNEIKNKLGNGIAASQSCVTAIYFALKYRSQNHESMYTQIYKLGGDTDTIGAMSGAIWGAFNGYNSLDKNKVKKIENSEKILRISEQLYIKSSNKNALSEMKSLA